MNDKPRYLELDDDIEDSKLFYRDLDLFLSFNEKQKERFFKEKEETISNLFVLANNNPQDMQIYYSLIGVGVELLLKTCILKANWHGYVFDYKSDKNKQSFKTARAQLLEHIKNKITEAQHIRLAKILEYVQTQRNNFVHSPFKGFDNYAIVNQIHIMVATLVSIYNLKLTDEAADTIFNNVKEYGNHDRIDFESVGLECYVEDLKSN